MSNELIWFLFLVFDFSFALLLLRLLGKQALYAIIVMDIVLCNIQVVKTISLFGIVTTTGNILYGSIFLATDLLGEVYGKKAARQGVILGFLALLFMVVAMQITLLLQPHSSDFAQPHLKAIFSVLPRIVLASLLAYLVSQFHDVWAFHLWKKKTRGKWLWLRNNASTMVSQFIDSVIFVSVAFIGVFPISVVTQILISTYLLKLLVALLDTPVMYLGKSILVKYHGGSSDAIEQP